jgi:DNA-binding transcriptional LysR family regulator
MNVTLRQLKVFAAVAQHGSLSRAAESLHLTPAAVSMQIRELERQVGLPMLDRGGRGVSLTVAGEYVLAYARKMLAMLKEAEDLMARFRGVTGGQLRVGFLSTAQHFAFRLLAQFRRDHPGVEVLPVIGARRDEVFAALQRHDIDLAIAGQPPRELALRAEPFAQHPLVLVTSTDHVLARAMGYVPALGLAEFPFIAREPGSGTRSALEHYFREQRIAPRIAFELPSNDAIKQAAAAGLGIALLSLHAVGDELRRGELVAPEVEGLPLVRRWHVVTTTGRPVSPATEALRYFILEHGERLLATEFGHRTAGG